MIWAISLGQPRLSASLLSHAPTAKQAPKGLPSLSLFVDGTVHVHGSLIAVIFMWLQGRCGTAAQSRAAAALRESAAVHLADCIPSLRSLCRGQNRASLLRQYANTLRGLLHPSGRCKGRGYVKHRDGVRALRGQPWRPDCFNSA